MEAGTAVATEWAKRKQQMLVQPYPCEVPGCRMYARRPDRFCAAHNARLKNAGHHTAGRVTLLELKPWRTLAMDFIERNAAHPGIVAAVAWVEERARVAAARDTGRQSRRMSPTERVDAYWSQYHRDAVDPWLVIAYGIAAEAHRQFFPERWPDLRHAEHNSGAAFASLIRGRVKSGKTEGRDTAAMRTPAGYLCALAREVRGALLPLFVKAASTIKAQAERTSRPIPAASLQQPFIVSGPAAEEQP